jgi:hypothetical protein
LAALLSAISLAYAGHFLWLGLSLANPMPIGDHWAFVADYLKYLDGHYSWPALLSQHNEHRLATTRIVLFADAILFGMRGLFAVAAMYASLATMAAIGAWVVSSRSNLERFTCFAAALGLVWSSAQWQDFGDGFQIQFVLVHLFAFICLFAVWCASQSRFFFWISVALTADALCVLSLGSGILVIVPAILLALFLRTWPAAVVLAIFHSALVVLYFTGYQTPVDAPHYHFDPTKSLRLVAEFIGLAFGKHEAIFGTLGLTLFAVVAAHISYLALVRRPAHSACYLMASLACFVVIEAVVVGYTRSAYDMAPRYATASVVFWAALLGLLWRLTEHLRTRWLVPLLAGGAIVAMNAPHFEAPWREHAAFLSRVTAEVRRGEFDPVSMERLCSAKCAVEPLHRLQRLEIGPFLPER